MRLSDATLTSLIGRVYAYVAYRVGSGHDAEDITSDAFERALRYRDTFDSNRGDALSWLIGIARRCIADHASQSEAPTEASWPNAESHESRVLRSLEVSAAVLTLPNRDREIIALRFGADMSAREIANVLGLRTNTVEVALHRALQRLRHELAPAAPRSHEATAAPVDATSS